MEKEEEGNLWEADDIAKVFGLTSCVSLQFVTKILSFVLFT